MSLLGGSPARRGLPSPCGAERLRGQSCRCPRQRGGHIPAPSSLCGHQQPRAASRGTFGQRWPKRRPGPAPAARRRGPAGGGTSESAVSEGPLLTTVTELVPKGRAIQDTKGCEVKPEELSWPRSDFSPRGNAPAPSSARFPFTGD